MECLLEINFNVSFKISSIFNQYCKIKEKLKRSWLEEFIPY